MLVKSPVVKIGALFVLLTLTLAACAAPDISTTSEPVANTAQAATPVPQEPTPTAVESGTRPIQITDVQVQIGVGSPIPVDVVASGDWPDLCAQLASVTQQFSGDRVEISLNASPVEPDCPPDLVGIPFRLAIPLNMVNKPAGTYSVVVNGVQTSFEWMTTSAEPQPVENLGLTFAYVGADGNLWKADASGGPPQQVTSDAAQMESGGDVVTYYFPAISSDGRYIAARRDSGVPVTEGIRYQFGLWVYDTQTRESKTVYESADSPPAGFDWKPGTHLLAYGIGSDPSYFISRGQPDASLATGINGVDMDSGASSLLVAPEKGYTLILPVWSPNSRFLSFDELLYMEGRGPFAYYDFEAQQYIAWGEPLGNYDWSPDGSQLVYDKLSYTANGTERIYSRPRQDGTEVQVSPDMDQGYAFFPVYSPDGQQIAYITDPGGPESTQHTLVVQDLISGEIRDLGSYESIWNLAWSSDGRALVFSAGPHESQQVYGYDLVNGAATVLVQGSQPSLARP